MPQQRQLPGPRGAPSPPVENARPHLKRATHRIKENIVQIIYSRLEVKSTAEATKLAIVAAEIIGAAGNVPDTRISAARLELPWSQKSVKLRRRLVRSLAALDLGWLRLRKAGNGEKTYWLATYRRSVLADADRLFGFRPADGGAEELKTPCTIAWRDGDWKQALCRRALEEVARRAPRERVRMAMQWLRRFFGDRKPPITRRMVEKNR